MPDDSFRKQIKDLQDCFSELFVGIFGPICTPILEFLSDKIKKGWADNANSIRSRKNKGIC